MLGGFVCFLFILFDGFYWIFVVLFLMGVMVNLLYVLLIVYVNDYFDCEDMFLVVGGFLFVNGVGVIMGLLIFGWMFE